MSYEAQLTFATELAEDAGKIMTQYFRTDELRPTWKRENDAVTVADTSINRLVIDRVKAAWPDDGVAGEEESYKPSRNNIWMTDPIDGTLPYTLGLPIAAFLLSYMIDGRPKVAVAFNPWMGLMYTAVEGEGAFCNGKEIPQLASSYTKVVELLIWKGSVFKLPGLRERIEEAGFVPLGIAGGILRFGLSEGRLPGVVYADDHPWDIAVLDLLVSEVGGIVTDLAGKQIDYRERIHGAVAGTTETHKQLLQLVKS